MGTKWLMAVAMALMMSLLFISVSNISYAARISDIRNTKHNFSATVTPALPGGASRVVSATTERQICVFCHTPHAAEQVPQIPLWNRKLSTATYETYRSGSLDSTGPDIPLGQPTGISKLCLSCHDGTMAIGAVNVLNGNFTDRNPLTQDIAMQGTGAGGIMAPGEGTDTGFTRYIGINLTNDHPISLTFNSALAAKDGEMRDPATSQYVGVRKVGVKPLLPLQPDPNNVNDGQVQCNTCHDPHIRDNVLNENVKFLRVERFQRVAPTITAFNPNQDIICLACHNKAGWVGSAHANQLVGNETYTNAAADVREFPQGIQVWQTACLACHDVHTVQGSRRLLREGTDGPTKISTSGYPIKQGGAPAIEQTCFACHSSDGGTLTAQGLNTEVPDIKTDFTTLATHMPITTQDQSNGANYPTEVHNIGTSPEPQAGKDFLESQAVLANRHVECTDCHNPHRVIKNRQFNANPNTPDPAGTHTHDGVTPHTNIASGVLKGSWGVQPTWNSPDFQAPPASNISFAIKRGDPQINGPTDVNQAYVTREYQICLKCHSNYAYGANPPLLGSFRGGTPSGTNGMTQYTNQANEYNSPMSHQGEAPATGGGADPRFESGVDANTGLPANNHRSWHPVVNNTGRTAAIRNADPNNWTTPFNLAVGTQTMYCTDCHGSNTQPGTAIPDGNVNTDNGRVWGPHGSENNFLLKGPWSGDTIGGTGEIENSPDAPSHICFKCHQFDQYGNTNPGVFQNSGFSLGGGGMGGGGMCMMGGGGGGMGGGGGGGMGGGGGGGMMCMPNTQNLHTFHTNAVTNFRCNLCHVAVPHGWKNKVFLVNLNDIGQEGGFPVTGNQVRNGTTVRYVNGPYYNNAVLKVRSFAPSGNWNPANCGSVGAPGNGAFGVFWMAMSTEACINTP